MVLNLKVRKSRSLPGLPRTLLLFHDDRFRNGRSLRAAVLIQPSAMPAEVCGAALRKRAAAASPPRRLLVCVMRRPVRPHRRRLRISTEAEACIAPIRFTEPQEFAALAHARHKPDFARSIDHGQQHRAVFEVQHRGRERISRRWRNHFLRGPRSVDCHRLRLVALSASRLRALATAGAFETWLLLRLAVVAFARAARGPQSLDAATECLRLLGKQPAGEPRRRLQMGGAPTLDERRAARTPGRQRMVRGRQAG